MTATAQVHSIYNSTQPAFIIGAIHDKAKRENRYLTLNEAERIIEQVDRARRLTSKRRK